MQETNTYGKIRIPLISEKTHPLRFLMSCWSRSCLGFLVCPLGNNCPSPRHSYLGSDCILCFKQVSSCGILTYDKSLCFLPSSCPTGSTSSLPLLITPDVLLTRDKEALRPHPCSHMLPLDSYLWLQEIAYLCISAVTLMCSDFTGHVRPWQALWGKCSTE